MIVPGFCHEADGVRLRGQQRHQSRIVRSRPSGTPRHAEGGEPRPHRPSLGKKARIGRVGTGVAGFDIIDAELIEHTRDGELVSQREVDAIGLRTVAQCGVEQIEPLARHLVGHDANRDRDDR